MNKETKKTLKIIRLIPLVFLSIYAIGYIFGVAAELLKHWSLF